MALQATIYNFDIELADHDRAVYESLGLRLARHPSESDEYLIARLLAYLLEFTNGTASSRGVWDPDEPAISRHPRLFARTDADAEANSRADRSKEWLNIHGRLSPGVAAIAP